MDSPTPPPLPYSAPAISLPNVRFPLAPPPPSPSSTPKEPIKDYSSLPLSLYPVITILALAMLYIILLPINTYYKRKIQKREARRRGVVDPEYGDPTRYALPHADGDWWLHGTEAERMVTRKEPGLRVGPKGKKLQRAEKRRRKMEAKRGGGGGVGEEGRIEEEKEEEVRSFGAEVLRGRVAPPEEWVEMVRRRKKQREREGEEGASDADSEDADDDDSLDDDTPGPSTPGMTRNAETQMRDQGAQTIVTGNIELDQYPRPQRRHSSTTAASAVDTTTTRASTHGDESTGTTKTSGTSTRNPSPLSYTSSSQSSSPPKNPQIQVLQTPDPNTTPHHYTSGFSALRESKTRKRVPGIFVNSKDTDGNDDGGESGPLDSPLSVRSGRRFTVGTDGGKSDDCAIEEEAHGTAVTESGEEEVKAEGKKAD